jgi:hypothetical protein
MTTDRFNQRPDEPYGYCDTCKEAGTNLEFSDRDEMQAHMNETYEASVPLHRSHSARVVNPTRMERIKRFLAQSADDAVDSALDEFIRDASRALMVEDATVAELTEAVKDVGADIDWREAWGNYVDENELTEEDDETPPPVMEHTTLEGLDA